MKYLFSLVLIIISITISAQKSTRYTIHGELKKVKTGTIYLTIYNTDSQINDSSKIINGVFNFKGNTDKPIPAYLTLPEGTGHDNSFLQFYVEPSDMTISGDGDTLSALHITGSKLNADNSVLKDLMKEITLWEERDSKIYAVAAKAKDKNVLDSLDAVDWQILAAKRKVVSTFINENPGSLSSAIAILDNYGYYAEAGEVEPLYNALTPSVKNTRTGSDVKKMLDTYKKVSIGMTLPDISQNDTLGHKLSLSSLKGHYVLVDFWASWCGPCRRENPNIVKTYEQYHPKGLEIFGVSYDNEKGTAKWKKAINDDHLFWYQVSDLQGWKNETSNEFYIKAIPANILLDKNGKIIAKNLFGKKLTDKLAELM